MVSLAWTKAIVLVVLLVLTFILGVLPIKLVHIFKRRARHKQLARTLATASNDEEETESLPTYKRVISFLSCFAAGVFLATCFLDLLPSVQRELMSVLDVYNIRTGFPTAEFIACLGLFAILITEQIVLVVKESQTHTPSAKQPLLTSDKSDLIESTHSDHSMSGIHDHHRKRQILKRSETISDDSCDDAHNVKSNDKCEESENQSPLRTLLLLIVLSLHSIFEGLAIGLQKNTNGVLEIFAALVLHKGILSFSLGMNLVHTRLSEGTTIRSILIFSLTAPIGIALGIGIMKFWDSTTSSLVQGILQGIASGTFLYITFFEVLPHEFNSSHSRLLKVFFLLFGFSAVTAILFLSDSVRKPLCAVTPTP
ncbi:zinc transporter ZIP1-like [Gigantopelta aegis]|uniref:zinc transporter ZIP1-like n=1 Tax=Gigantopelta aegis TaxID=1735272 RepID=UPI001B88D6D7|nr:zinc transporter ZIP1-like [Gigantopelta aegis]